MEPACSVILPKASMGTPPDLSQFYLPLQYIQY